MIVLDTNVVSELARSAPDPRVAAWAAQQDLARVVITVVTEAELRAGIAMMPEGRRRTEVEQAVMGIIEQALRGRVLPLDRAAPPYFAAFRSLRRAAGRTIDAADALIAATARAHGATLIATRDLPGFEGCGVPLVDPWAA